jgi:hypothetical protein
MHAWSATVLVLAGAFAASVVEAHFVPAPCDFITGGGWVIADSGAHVNFGSHGGCKNGAFWGHVNVVDHSSSPPGHLKSIRITGYLMDPAFPNARDICGEAEVTVNGSRFTTTFRVRMEDNGEPGGADRFGVRLNNGYHLSTRELGPPGPTGGGGNIQLHKPNPSTTGPFPPPTEFEMCGSLPPP